MQGAESCSLTNSCSNIFYEDMKVEIMDPNTVKSCKDNIKTGYLVNAPHGSSLSSDQPNQKDI